MFYFSFLPESHFSLLDSAAHEDTEEAGHDHPEAEGEQREPRHPHVGQLVPELRNQLGLKLLLGTERGGSSCGRGPPRGRPLSGGGHFRGRLSGGLAHWRLLWRP